MSMSSAIDSSMGAIIVVVLLAMMIVEIFYNRRQAEALEAMREAEERRFILQLKRGRDEAAGRGLPQGGAAWLTEQVRKEFGISLSLEAPLCALRSFPTLVIRTGEGGLILASALKPGLLKKKLKDYLSARGSLSDLTEESMVLEMLRKARLQGRRGLDNAGDYFDLDAEKAGKDLGVEWGRADHLYLMYCPKGRSQKA